MKLNRDGPTEVSFKELKCGLAFELEPECSLDVYADPRIQGLVLRFERAS